MVIIDSIIYIAFTLMIWSILYKENIFYRFAEYTVTGIATGWLASVVIKSITTYSSVLLTQLDYSVIIGLFFGLLLYTRYFKPIKYYSRWSTSIIIGTLIGVSVRTTVQAQIIKQILGTVLQLNDINNILMMIMFGSALMYFLFYIDITEGSFGIIPKIGRITLMAGFGAGYAAMALSFYTYIVQVLWNLRFNLFNLF